MSEVWKDIPGYEGLYQVSNLGNVKSLDRKVINSIGIERNLKGSILKFKYYKSGRPCVELYRNGKSKVYKPYYLVMLAFVGARPDDFVVTHKDGDFLNNKLENLSYDTQSQNQIDLYRQGKSTSTGKLSINEVLEIRKLYNTGNYTQKELATMFDISRGSISNIVVRRTFQWLNDDGTIQKSNTAVS